MLSASPAGAERPASALLSGQVLCMLGMSTYAVLLPLLRQEWALSNAQAGLIGSGFFFGYICTVTFWSTLTDRMDARRIYFVGCLLACAGMGMFGLLAHGFWMGLLAHIVYGVGVSAAYMPGLKILSDRYQGARQSRVFSFYTAFYGLGAAISLATTQWLSDAFGWRWAFALAAAGPLVALLLVAAWTRAQPAAGNTPRHPPGWRDAFPVRAWVAVLQQPRSRLFVVGYLVHCLEMFGARAWLVAFLVFAGGTRLPLSAGALAALVSLASVGASILGNEAALRLGRERWIRWVMVVSPLLGVAMAASAAAPWPLLVALVAAHALALMAESATLTAGLVETTEPARRGTALGLYSLAGFGGGMVGPALFGLALDATGGGRQGASWVAGFAALGAGCLALGIHQFRGRKAQQQPAVAR